MIGCIVAGVQSFKLDNFAEVLVIAGGGGGGADLGGGGGAGGYRTNSSFLLNTGASLTVTVGAGGNGGGAGIRGSVGANSVFSTITSTGGGGGSLCGRRSRGDSRRPIQSGGGAVRILG